ncbi:helix-turn-helix domain-containing protein [Phytopseudomonas daroniae]|uniref:helix-turn-helix domain-containing protein n=1 Tax=Phytopseudomonas daroniae TaxID=2487519 RepID=UPI0010384E56|nr:helix-turn-helix transcriptional regulator [Pseudomonas daroniae]TBU78183.1 transcriptional regulator [Pseudomonas daroniae]
MNIGERLREERVRLGYNQADFAAIAGVAKTSQFNYEKGERSPDASYLAAVAEKGVDVLYVVTGKRTPEAADAISASEADLLDHFRLLPEGEQGYTRTMVAALAERAGRDVVKK